MWASRDCLLAQSEIVSASDKKVHLLTEAEKNYCDSLSKHCATTSYMFDMSARIAEAVGKVIVAERDFQEGVYRCRTRSLISGLPMHASLNANKELRQPWWL